MTLLKTIKLKKHMVTKNKELIDPLDTAITIESLFTLKKIEMKDDLAWRMKLEIKNKLEHTYREYDVKFSINEEPFEMRISDLNRQIEEVKNQNQLFGDAKKDQINSIKNEIKEVQQELKDLKDDCGNIEFPVTIEELKYKDGNTIIVMIFPATSLEEINEKRRDLASYYKIELIRE